MFCTNCGTSLVDTARFCSVCGTQVPGTGAREPQRPQGAPPPAASGYQQQGHNSPPAHQQSVYSPQSLYAQPNQSPQVGINTYAIFASSGHPQAAFDQIAGAIFHALDRNIEPRNTGGIEISKLVAYRTLGGENIPPYYGEYIVPTYASVVGIELVTHRSQNSPILTWNGWRQFLLQKIMSDPDAACMRLSRLVPALGIQIQIDRIDFPPSPFPQAVLKEAQFRSQLAALAGTAGMMGGGSFGGGFGGGFGGSPPGGGAGHSSGSAGSMFKLAAGGMKFLNNGGFGGGGA